VSSPIPEQITLLQCDVDENDSTDGITQFNLEQLFTGISYATYDFQFYTSEANQRNNTPITELIGYQNTSPFSETQEYPNLDVTFFENLTDLTLELNPVSGQVETASRNYYARIEDAGQCQGAEVIELVVNFLPEIDFLDEITLCTDGDSLALNAPLTLRRLLVSGKFRRRQDI